MLVILVWQPLKRFTAFIMTGCCGSTASILGKWTIFCASLCISITSFRTDTGPTRISDSNGLTITFDTTRRSAPRNPRRGQWTLSRTLFLLVCLGPKKRQAWHKWSKTAVYCYYSVFVRCESHFYNDISLISTGECLFPFQISCPGRPNLHFLERSLE